jgi:hypothetical protein
MALNIFSEFPLVEMATKTSPALRWACTWRENISSAGKSLPKAVITLEFTVKACAFNGVWS